MKQESEVGNGFTLFFDYSMLCDIVTFVSKCMEYNDIEIEKNENRTD